MTGAEFAEAIGEAYGGKQGMRQAIAHEMTGINGDKLQKLYRAVLRSHKYASPPNLAQIREYAKDSDIKLDRKGQSQAESFVTVCEYCECRFDHTSRCPSCYELPRRSVLIRGEPDNQRTIKERQSELRSKGVNLRKKLKAMVVDLNSKKHLLSLFLDWTFDEKVFTEDDITEEASPKDAQDEFAEKIRAQQATKADQPVRAVQGRDFGAFDDDDDIF